MRIRDLFYETFSAIQANRGRSLLTILGIVIGIAAVISMTALIDGVKASLVGELGLSQSRTVMIDCWPGREVTMDDIDALEAGMSDDYEFITAASYNSGTVSNGVTQEDGTFLGVEPDGENINKGVGSTHLDNLEKAVVEGGFDCGIAFDGDADRCLACDEKGREMDGDKIIALLAMTMKEKDRLDGDTAVVTVMSNLGFIKYMESQGIHTEKTAVGDRYVLENMRENGYAIGGEQSGHVILLHHATTGDGELTAGKLLKLLAESGKKMSELNGIYAQYPQVLVNVTANAAQKKAYKEDEVLAGFIENEQQKLMGMGRVLVRVSGTEPKIRVMVEGQDLEAIHRCADRIVEKINKRILKQ